MRDELLNESLFLDLDLDHARTKITNWVDDYNQRRPHSALGYLTPVAYAANLVVDDEDGDSQFCAQGCELHPS